MKRSLKALGLALALAATATLGSSAIEKLTLDQMLERADNAVVGTIVDRHVFRADDPQDGTMYFTTITVKGTSLVNERSVTVPITYIGGFIDEDEGTHTSVTPDPNETAVGKRVVAFWMYNEAMGYGVSGNQLYAMHGGIFPVVQRGTKQLALGKGEGFAIDQNQTLPTLRQRAAKIAEALEAEGKQFK